MEKAIIVDLDGTLADVEHRVEFVRITPKNWKEFNDRMIHDPINHWCEEFEGKAERAYKNQNPAGQKTQKLELWL